MKLSLFYLVPGSKANSAAEAYKMILNEAELADDLGFESLFYAEHHFSEYMSLTPSPNLIVAAVASRTKRIKIGLAVSVVPLHHPIRLVEEAAMLDHLTEGRFIMGMGRGHSPNEFKPWGIPLEESRARFEEYWEIMLKAWSGEPFSHEGTYWNIPETVLVPKGYRQPLPEIWYAGSSIETIRFAAKNNFTLPVIPINNDEFNELLSTYRKEANIPTGPINVVPLRYAYCGETDKEAYRIAEPGLVDYWNTVLTKRGQITRMEKPPKGYEEHIDRTKRRYSIPADVKALCEAGVSIVGGPETFIEALKELQARGIDHVMLDLWTTTQSHDERIHAMKMLATKVLPNLN